MRVLAFRHGPHEHLGWICDALDAHDIAYDYADSDATPDEAHLREAGALIFLGGGWEVDSDSVLGKSPQSATTFEPSCRMLLNPAARCIHW